MASKYKKGDLVKVLNGKNAGKQGKILKVNPEKQLITVEGINIVTRHLRPTKESKGGRIETPAPFSWSKARIICPFTKKPTGISFVVVDGKKKRKSKVSGEDF